MKKKKVIKKLNKVVTYWMDKFIQVEEKAEKLEQELKEKTGLWEKHISSLLGHLDKALTEGSEVNIRIVNPSSQSSYEYSNAQTLPEEGKGPELPDLKDIVK